MASEATKEKMAEILFGMVAQIVLGLQQRMAFPSWQVVDKETREDYMRVVDNLIKTLDTEKPVEVDSSIIEKAEEHLSAQPVGFTDVSHANSDLLASIIGYDTAHPVKLAPTNPEREARQKVMERMAKARAARGKKPVAVATT